MREIREEGVLGKSEFIAIVVFIMDRIGHIFDRILYGCCYCVFRRIKRNDDALMIGMMYNNGYESFTFFMIKSSFVDDEARGMEQSGVEWTGPFIRYSNSIQ